LICLAGRARPTNNNCNYQNASGNGIQMVYGNGLSTADDIDAHELTRAVTELSARLFYYITGEYT